MITLNFAFFKAAQCNGVPPLEEVALMSAPRSSNNLITSTFG